MSESEFDFSVDFRFIGIDYELWALGEYLSLVERQLPNLGQQARQRYITQLQEDRIGPDDPERDIAFRDLYELVDNVLPRFFRGPLLVALWAIYESAVNEVASYLQKEFCAALGLRDIRGEDFLIRATKYFEHVLKFPLCTDERTRARLDMLMTLRNAIAHGGGRMSAVNKEAWRKIEGWANDNVGISVNENLMFSESFLHETYLIVNESVRDLLRRARGASQ